MRPADERGSVLVTVLLVSVVFAILGTTLLRSTFAELDLTGQSQAVSRSLQAAEAGVNDYIAKLTEDHLYYAHWVHRAEATRAATSTGTRYDPSALPLAFDGTLAWTYPNGRDGWLDLGDGLEYDLQVFPPTPTRTTVRIVATGRRTGDPSSARTVEALVRTASIADFQMIANADVLYGSTATANGKIYAGISADGVKHNIGHAGTVNANLYAEGSIYRTAAALNDAQGRTPGSPGWNPTYGNWTGSPSYTSPATGYDLNTIRTVIKTPINFNDFTGSIDDVQRAAVAASDGINLPTLPAGSAYWLTFQSGGTVQVRTCTGVDLTANAPLTPPPCGTATTKAVPTNGAVYVPATVIVSGTVKGRVTVATTGDLVVGGDIDYASTGTNVGLVNTDVLGLMAQNEVLVPRWAPTNLTWRAGTIAMQRQWRSASSPTPPTHGTMTFYGSTAANLGGYMSQYATRNYNYDPSLLYLQPPYFPVLEDAYTIVLEREIH